MKVRTIIKLEKFTENDFPYYFRLVNDEKVMEMITEKAIGLKAAKADFEKLIENNGINEHFGNFKILDSQTIDFIGLAKLEIKEENSTAAELGYMILPQYWGKGFAGKSATLLMEKAKKQPSIKKLFAIIDPKNAASRKILTNNGFVSKEVKDFGGLPGEVLELNV